MAESQPAGAPALNTNIESGDFNEKDGHHAEAPATKPKTEEEDEDEDIDALIEDLESQDGHGFDEEEEGEVSPATGRVVPEEMLQTDTRVGLTESGCHRPPLSANILLTLWNR